MCPQTVKYFNAEKHEELRFDTALEEYQRASTLSNQVGDTVCIPR